MLRQVVVLGFATIGDCEPEKLENAGVRDDEFGQRPRERNGTDPNSLEPGVET